MIFPNIIWLCEEIKEIKVRDYYKFRDRLESYTIGIENQEGEIYFINEEEDKGND